MVRELWIQRTQESRKAARTGRVDKVDKNTLIEVERHQNVEVIHQPVNRRNEKATMLDVSLSTILSTRGKFSALFERT
jgi:hypothetical protein